MVKMAAAQGSILYEPKDLADLAGFLKANKEKYHKIWVVITKKAYADPQPLSFNEAVGEAIAQALVDSRTKTLDGKKYAVLFTKRKSKKA
jgi:hypothetical protein